MRILVSACLMGVYCRYNGQTQENESVMRLARRHELIPFCPEIYGGLPTPREPSEIREGRVLTPSGRDVTREYERGADECARLAKMLHCDAAVLQDRSPSCGCGVIHDGFFGGGLIEGDGIATRALKKAGVSVLPASRADELR